MYKCTNHHPSRPTVETRNALYTGAARTAEDARVQLRKHHQALLKKENIAKHSPDFSTVRVAPQPCFIANLLTFGTAVSSPSGQVAGGARQDPSPPQEDDWLTNLGHSRIALTLSIAFTVTYLSPLIATYYRSCAGYKGMEQKAVDAYLYLRSGMLLRASA